MAENIENPNPPGQAITRREFFGKILEGAKTAAALYIAVSMPSTLYGPLEELADRQEQPKQVTAPEKLKTISANTVMIDFAPEKPAPAIDANANYNNIDLVKALSGDDFIEPEKLQAEFGADCLDNMFRIVKRVFPKYPKAAMVYGVVGYFADHGTSVSQVLENIRNKKGYTGTANIIPLQAGIQTEGKPEFGTDNFGNPTLNVVIEPEPIISALNDYPEQKIVNFSFQAGKLGYVVEQKTKETEWEIDAASLPGFENSPKDYTYITGGKTYRAVRNSRGKIEFYLNGTLTEPPKEVIKKTLTRVVSKEMPSVQAIGAYTKERVGDNIPKLIKICEAHKDKLFIAAAGNFSDDLREARNKLASVWPSNLLTVAQWSDKTKAPNDNVYGADIYVDNSALGLGWGSSFSTPAVTALASVLEHEGLSIDQIKEKILSDCNGVVFQPVNEEGVSEEALLLDPKKAGLIE